MSAIVAWPVPGAVGGVLLAAGVRPAGDAPEALLVAAGADDAADAVLACAPVPVASGEGGE